MGAAELRGWCAAKSEDETAFLDCRLGLVCQMDAVFHREKVAGFFAALLRHEGRGVRGVLSFVKGLGAVESGTR